MKLTILEPLAVSSGLLEDLAKDIKAAGWEIEIYDTRPSSQKELGERLASSDAAVIANYPLQKEALAAAARLKYLCIAFTGVDHVDISCCRDKGIAVSNCAGYSTQAVAELAIGMTLSLFRRLSEADAAVRGGKTNAGFMGTELSGKRFGIIGTGAIGMRTAAIAKAFGASVLGYSRTRKADGIQYEDLDTVLSESDVVSLHLPLTPATRGLIGARELSLMKPSAILINTARGPVVDSKALAEALRTGAIRGAAIDVYESEPPIPASHPLLSAPNCLLTPHLGFFSAEAMKKRAAIVFDNLKAWEEGHQKNIIC